MIFLQASSSSWGLATLKAIIMLEIVIVLWILHLLTLSPNKTIFSDGKVDSEINLYNVL